MHHPSETSERGFRGSPELQEPGYRQSQEPALATAGEQSPAVRHPVALIVEVQSPVQPTLPEQFWTMTFCLRES